VADALPTLLLFARTPAAGSVKTRLVPPLSDQEVLALYLAFLEDAAAAYAAPGQWNAVLEVEPDPEDPALAALFRVPWVRRRQAAGDLGNRLAFAFEREFGAGAPAALAVGSDHPALERRLLEEAFLRLRAGDSAVVIPAEDGGYCAIGLRSGVSVRQLFEGIPWSTAAVLEKTRERLAALRLEAAFLETGYDVDRPEDLERLRRDLLRRHPAAPDYPRATARVLGGLRSGSRGFRERPVRPGSPAETP
jgi:rSAM/selenodomain-associated transferase 1